MEYNNGGNYEFNEKEVKTFLAKVCAELTEEDVFIAVTRKGYWIAKLLFEKENILYSFISDRRVMKDFDFDCIKGKRVYIFDDTVNNGNKMFFYYALFKEKKAREIVPLVYALSAEYLMSWYKNPGDAEKIDYTEKVIQYKRVVRQYQKTEDDIRTEAIARLKEFNGLLKYCKILTVDDISRFSLAELIWLQKKQAPLVMDLPILKYMKTDETDIAPIVLKKWQFDKLCENSFRWTYHENYHDMGEVHLTSGFFRLKDEVLFEKFKNVIFDFVVKCKYNEQLDNITAVFTPFAVLRSYSFADMWECFCVLYEGTEYFELIEEYIENNSHINNPNDFIKTEQTMSIMQNNHNLCRAIFRAVIYQLSMYIGFLFKEKVNESIGIELECDFDIMKDHNIEAFNSTIKQQWEKYNREEFERRLFGLQNAEAIAPINVRRSKQNVKVFADEELIYLYIRERLILAKYEGKNMKEKLVTIETLEEELEQQFVFESQQQKKLYLTKAILYLLEYSCMGNEIYVDNVTGNVYRGFRAGENSEILFKYGMKWVYPYAYRLYCRNTELEYRQDIKELLESVEVHFEEEGYFKTIIGKSAFQIYKRYFINMVRLREQMENKLYLFDGYVKKTASEVEIVLINEAFEYVDIWLNKREVKYAEVY